MIDTRERNGWPLSFMERNDMSCWRTKKPHFIIAKQNREWGPNYLVLGGGGEGTWYFSCICGNPLLSFKRERNGYDIQHSLLVMHDYLWWTRWKLWKKSLITCWLSYDNLRESHNITYWLFCSRRQHVQIYYLSINCHDRLAFLLTSESPASRIVLNIQYMVGQLINKWVGY